MEISEYQHLILKTRANYTQVSLEMVRKLEQAFQKAYEDVNRLLIGIDHDP